MSLGFMTFKNDSLSLKLISVDVSALIDDSFTLDIGVMIFRSFGFLLVLPWSLLNVGRFKEVGKEFEDESTQLEVSSASIISVVVGTEATQVTVAFCLFFARVAFALRADATFLAAATRVSSSVRLVCLLFARSCSKGIASFVKLPPKQMI